MLTENRWVTCFAMFCICVASTGDRLLGQGQIDSPLSVLTTPPITTTIFSNTTPVPISDADLIPGIGTPYPSTINVQGFTGNITDLNVRINGLTHSFPNDVSLLLVAPNGARMVIQSGVGGDVAITNVTYTLDDQATAGMGSTGALISGAYRPTSTLDPDFFPQTGPNPPPATCQQVNDCAQPAPTGSATLNSTFGETSPNGEWRLYVIDSSPGSTGTIAGGWSLMLGKPVSVPTLMLDAGQGLRAEFSNYYLTNYETANGLYKGTFCYSLRNISPPSSRQFYVIAVQVDPDNVLHLNTFMSGYSITGSFAGAPSLILETARGLMSFGGDRGAPDPTSGIPPGGTASFCMGLESTTPFQLPQLMQQFFATFSNGLPAAGDYFVSFPLGTRMQIEIRSLSDTRLCFDPYHFSVFSETSVSGFGFDLPGDQLFSLGWEINATLKFSNSPQRLRYFDGSINRHLDFGFLAGQTLAKGPFFQLGGKTTYCVDGDFTGLTPAFLLASVKVRLPEGWSVYSDPGGNCGRCERGTRGLVASNPR